jgi:hypothetical protein
MSYDKKFVSSSFTFISSIILMVGCSGSSSSAKEVSGEASGSDNSENMPIVLTAGNDHFIDLSVTNRIELSGNAISTAGGEIISYSWVNNDSIAVSNNDQKVAYAIIDDSFSSETTTFRFTAIDSFGNEFTDDVSYGVLNAGSSLDCEDEVEKRLGLSIYNLGVSSFGQARDLDIEINENEDISFNFKTNCLSPIPFKAFTASVRSSTAPIYEVSNNDGGSLAVSFGEVDRDTSVSINVRYEFKDGSKVNESFFISINDEV